MEETTPNNNKSNASLRSAKKAKDDEFYTQRVDIENELFNYSAHFKNKVVFCNCDDPESSHFWKYLSNKFDSFGLKKLISTHYTRGTPSYSLERTSAKSDPVKTPLTGDGDFRSPEAIALLEQADIVVTNPPFSLFREYVAQLIEYEKQFLIIGSMNAISYKEIFKLIKNNQLWLGIGTPKVFNQPDGTVKKFGNIHWYTNLSHKKRNEELILYKSINDTDADYPKYDSYDAIEVSKVKDIPKDYSGPMGVPITFLSSYNPSQFEIVDGIGRYSMLHGPTEETKGTYLTKINGEPRYARIIIKNKAPK